MTDETQELAKEVFKSDMKTAELMRKLVSNNSVQEVSDASVEVVKEMHDKIEDPQRRKSLFATAYQIGNAVENPELVQFAGEHLQKMEQENGQ